MVFEYLEHCNFEILYPWVQCLQFKVGILRRQQKVEALLFRKPIKNIHFKKTPFLKITNFAHFGFITLEFSDIFDPWATLVFQLPLIWNMCFWGVHNLHGPDFAVASIMECVFWGSYCPRVGENIPHAYIEVYIFETLSRTIAFIFAFASQNN